MLISLIIPAYNEAQRIRRALDEFGKYFYPGNLELVVVLNGCRDNTREVVEQAQRELGRVIVIHELKESGKGRALKYGFQQARGDLVGYLDADGSTSPSEYQKLLEPILHEAYDGAIAARWGNGAKVVGRTTVLRTIFSYGFYVFTKILFWLPYRDTQCGAKIFRRSVIAPIVDQLQVTDMSFDVELLVLLKKAGAKIKEVPTVWIDRSSVEMSSGKLLRASWKMFISLFKIRFSH
jgi:glycosyltransferase involved in cell wall biosynthesis